MNDTSCPNCGEEENLSGDSKETDRKESITVTCGECGVEWERDLKPQCSKCGTRDLRVAVRSIVDKSRGTQLSIQSLSVVYLCPSCDKEEVAAWNQSNTPLPPVELPYDVEQFKVGSLDEFFLRFCQTFNWWDCKDDLRTVHPHGGNWAERYQG